MVDMVMFLELKYGDYNMSLLDIFRSNKPTKLENSEPNTILDVGVTDIYSNVDYDSVDWEDVMPDLVIPSIINLRKAAKTPLVQGILFDFIMKSISGYVITGDNQEAVDFIIEQDKRWDLKSIMFNVAYANFVQGIIFHEKIVEDNLLTLREIAFDGNYYRMKELYDKTGAHVIGYMQWVGINQNTNQGWLKKDFFDLVQSEEWKTVRFELEDIAVACFFRIDGKPYAILRGVLDKVYELEQLNRQLPSIVFKNSNIMVVTTGNKEKKEMNLTEKESNLIAEQFYNYHNKGVVEVPYGVEPDMIGDNVLPKVEEYIAALKSQIYEGLITPEAVFSASSSNRSTAVVQLDSDKSGRVLMQEFIQEKLSRYVEEEIFNTQLELSGYPTDSVWIEFNILPEDNTGAYNTDGTNVSGNTTIEENNINVTPTTGLNIDNIRNAEGRLNG